MTLLETGLRQIPLGPRAVDSWLGENPEATTPDFIAEVERGIERYGMDETEPIPAPPAGPVDVARVRLPSLGVDAAVARYGVDRYGRLDVPQDTTTVGWNPGFTAMPGTWTRSPTGPSPSS